MLSHTQLQRTTLYRNGFMSCFYFLPNSLPWPRDGLCILVLRLESYLLSNTNPDLHTLYIPPLLHIPGTDFCLSSHIFYITPSPWSLELRLHPQVWILSSKSEVLTALHVLTVLGPWPQVSLIRSVLHPSKPHTTALVLKGQVWKSANIKSTQRFLTLLIPLGGIF